MATHRLSRQRRNGLAIESLEGRVLLSKAPAAAIANRTAEVSILRRTEASRPNATRWAWLANTYWYVPTRNLPATVFDPSTGALAPVRDQTVYHITGYRTGFFWGKTVSQIGSQGTPTSSALVGSVTPQGRVLLTFTSSGGVVQGYGTMIRKAGRWTMENQMFTEVSSGTQIGHWAYMAPTRPGMKSWASLPLVRVSVPTFLSNYSLPAPTPVVGS